jgi:membrane fusion protein (multidrug efflux system)
MRWTPLIFALLAAALIAACGEGEKKPMAGPVPGPGAVAPPPAEVEVLAVGLAPATLTQDLPGRLIAFRSAQVRARVEGVLEKRLFAEGSDVAAGKPLFQIDARLFQANLAAAEAELATVRASSERLKPLLELKAVSQQEYDLAASRVKQVEAQLARARLDLDNATPTAPIAGRIGRALLTEGALVGRGEATHLATIEQVDPIRVEFAQSYADLLQLQQSIKAGKRKRAESTRIQLLLDDGSLYPEPGTLRFTDLAVDPATGSVVLRADFPNPRRELLPGTFARVRFPQADIDGAIRIPQRAVTASPLGQAVMTVDAEGKVSPRPIKTSGMSGTDFIVDSGLKPGEQVIVNGLQKARPGATVKPIPWDPSRKAGPPPAAVSPAPTSENKPAAGDKK